MCSSSYAKSSTTPPCSSSIPAGRRGRCAAGRHSVLSTSTFGTERMSAADIAGALLEQRQVRVSDEIEPGQRVLNLTETVAAQEKAAEIGERFTDWIWSDPDRAARLARHYNDTFNAIVLRSYDGAQMQLPGLTVTFTPRAHQVAAVARIVAEPAVLLAHEVGAGKTAEMVIGAMELRRLGMAQKPAVVVPEPHARAVLPRMDAALPAGPHPRRHHRRPQPRQAADARRADRDRRLGRSHPVPLGVRAGAAVGPCAAALPRHAN